MVVARLGDGRLVVHNAIALDETEMEELDGFGKVVAILVPNGFHRQDALIWKLRYPQAKVYCPKRARKKVSRVVDVDGDYDDVPQDGSVRIKHVDGMDGGEGYVQVTSADEVSVVFNDVVLNVPKLSGPMGFVLAPTGRPSVPRFMRWFMVKDRRALAEQLRRLAETRGLKRILVAHGATIEDGPSEVLSGLAAELAS